MTLKGFIFDIDGTLIDSNDAHASCLQKALESQGYNFEYQCIRNLIGMGFDKIIPKLIDEDSSSKAGRLIGKIKDDCYKKKFGTIRSFRNVRELFKMLSEMNFRLTIASSASRADLEKSLEKIGILEFLVSPVSAEDVNQSKPSVDPILTALEVLQLSPNEVYMVGDTPYDIEAAAKAGVETIAFRSGGRNDSDLAAASIILDGPSDLLLEIQAGRFQNEIRH